MTADLKDPAGLALVLDLVERADVLLEGFRPGVAERLGLGPEDCAARNPRLVYGRITGWGQDGPRAARAGHDLNYLGLTGALAAIGREGGTPVPPLNLVADFGGGSMLLLVGVLAALVERRALRAGAGRRRRDGRRRRAAVHHALELPRPGASGTTGCRPTCSTAPRPSTTPTPAPTAASSRSARSSRSSTRLLLDGLGLGGADLPEQYDSTGWPALRAAFTEAFASRTRDAWAEVFDGVDACVTPVVELAEVAREPHLVARGTFLRTAEGVLQPAPAPRFSSTAPVAPVAPVGAEAADVLDGWA